MALLAKLGGLDHDQVSALVEGVTRFWERTDLPTDEALRITGVLK